LLLTILSVLSASVFKKTSNIPGVMVWTVPIEINVTLLIGAVFLAVLIVYILTFCPVIFNPAHGIAH